MEYYFTWAKFYYSVFCASLQNYSFLFQYFIIVAFVTVVRGGVIAPAAVVSDATFDPNPAYSFAYDVQDALTGDSKSQVESRANGVVRGQYTVADPDGTRRIVDYYADPVHGFNAVVRKGPQVIAAPIARAVAPVAPVAHLAPVAAPIARSFSPGFPAAPLLARSLASPILPAPVAPVAGRLASPFLPGPGIAPYAVSPGLAPYSLAPTVF